MKIYLDYAATSPLHPKVIEKMTEAMTQTFGNPSSLHKVGRQSKKVLLDNRQIFADSIGANENEIIITSGGSEGNNLAIFGSIFHENNVFGKHLITTNQEHASVYEPMKKLEAMGYEVTYLATDEKGQISLQELQDSLREDTVLVSIMSINNETGNIQPIKEASKIIREQNPKIIFHTDAVQAFGKVSVDVNQLDVDLLTTSGHKIGGPKGIGFLYHREGIKLEPLIHGGEQEDMLRAGTENIVSIIGYGEAVNQVTTDFEEKMESLKNSYQLFYKKIKNQIDFEINGDSKNKTNHILNIWLKGIPSKILLAHLDMNGIAVSTGSACSSGNTKPSRILVSMFGTNSERLSESIRISFSNDLTTEEIKSSAQILIDTVKKIKKNNKGRNSNE